jgi:DtxR family transcriptional regulator, Mn-dependent transcriptional regulator
VSPGFHPPLEEYLEAIYGLSEEGVEVIQARLVERLGFTPQAVSEMVQRLIADGYLDRAGRSVTLTATGTEQAVSIVRRHRLAECFLVDILGLPWDKAHLEAGRWEHVISDDVEARFVALLGNPMTCPHGSPIPGSGGTLAGQIAIADVTPGTAVHLARVTERIETDASSLAYCLEHGLTPGRKAIVVEKSPDGTLTVSLDPLGGVAETLALGVGMTRQIFVAID